MSASRATIDKKIPRWVVSLIYGFVIAAIMGIFLPVGSARWWEACVLIDVVVSVARWLPGRE